MKHKGLLLGLVSFSTIVMVAVVLNLLDGVPAAAQQATSSAELFVCPSGCPYTTLQAAVDAAQPGSVIKVAAAVYTGVTSRGGMDQVLYIDKDLTIHGGYYDEFVNQDPGWHPTVLDAQNEGRVLSIIGPVSVTLEGLHLTNGSSQRGGGLYALDAHLAISRSQIYSNQAAVAGGGLWLEGITEGLLINARIYNNTAGESGGGAAITATHGTLRLTNLKVYSNTAGSRGGGIDVSNSKLVLVNLLAYKNHLLAGGQGAAIASNASALQVLHATLASNQGSSSVALSNAAQAMFTNTILVSHTVGVTVTAGSTATFHSTLWGSGPWANGQNAVGAGSIVSTANVTGDPAFSNPILDNYHITSTTAALNNGVTTGIAYDIDDAARPTDPPDLGAYEYKPGLLLHVMTEFGGDIDVGEADGSYENKQGSFFWNGSQWVTNDTAAHMYFWDKRDGGKRVKSYTLLGTIDGSTGTLWNQAGYTVTHTPYTYRVGTTDGGAPFIYQAVEYHITTPAGEVLILRSRGTGQGLDSAYLDIYVQKTLTNTIAFRGDPVWYQYSLPAEQAVLQTSKTAGRVGTLPTSNVPDPQRGQYWLDVNGGSDMGGDTFYFRTAALTSTTEDLGSSFPVEFRVKFMDASSTLKEFRILPTLLSETRARMLYLPLVMRQTS